MKQAIVVRTDLCMGVGKIAAQACHASLGAALKTSPEHLQHWVADGQTKVVLRVDSSSELNEIVDRAQKLGITYSLVADAGRTEVAPGTITALAIGPDNEEAVDAVAGSLPLLK